LSTVSFGPAVASTLVPSHLESIATHSERMIGLPAGRGRRVMRRDRSRREHLYGIAVELGSLMRHLRGLASIEVALLPCSVVGSTRFGALIAATRCAS
jgi:hypothetical protein